MAERPLTYNGNLWPGRTAELARKLLPAGACRRCRDRFRTGFHESSAWGQSFADTNRCYRCGVTVRDIKSAAGFLNQYPDPAGRPLREKTGGVL